MYSIKYRTKYFIALNDKICLCIFKMTKIDDCLLSAYNILHILCYVLPMKEYS